MTKKTDNQDNTQQADDAAAQAAAAAQDDKGGDAAADGGGAADLENVDEAAIWDEIEAEEAAAKAPADDAKGSTDKDAGAAAAKDKSTQGAANQQQASDDAAAAGGKQAANAAGSQQQEDIWKDATPAQRAAFEAAEKRAKDGEQYRKSNDGRIAALQRKIDELTNKGAAPAAAAGGKKSGKQLNAEDLLNDPDLVKTAKDYPEFAPFIKVIGKLQEQLTGQNKVLSAIGDERRQAALSEQKELLTTAHNDWEAVAEREDFGPWLEKQPRHIREAFSRNMHDIVDAEEAADVIGRFKDHLRANGQYQDARQQGNGGTQQQDNGTQAGSGAGNQQLDGRRQRQQVSASSTRTRGPSVASGIPENGDEKALWNMWEEHDKRQAARA